MSGHEHNWEDVDGIVRPDSVCSCGATLMSGYLLDIFIETPDDSSTAGKTGAP